MKRRWKLLYCKYCFKACSIANAMEHAINYIKKNITKRFKFVFGSHTAWQPLKLKYSKLPLTRLTPGKPQN